MKVCLPQTKAILLCSCVALMLPFAASAQQLQMYCAPALVDSFPVVRIGVSVSDSGNPAQPLSVANFTLTEDGKNVSPFALLNCAGAPAAAIAVLSDVTSSMFSSTGNGNTGKYFDSYSKFLAQVSAPSQLALVPFTDTVAMYFPGGGKWYNAGVMLDTTAFMAAVHTFSFQGNTSIDRALDYAVNLLMSNPLPRKVIVLVTDDGVVNETYAFQQLRANGISLFIMEIDKDTIWSNADLASAVGGRYYSAPDSASFVPVMTAIGKSFLAEQCLLRYISALPCPWEATHRVNVQLNFNNESASANLQYSLGHTTRDSVAPLFKQDSSRYTSRVVKAVDVFPCESGIQFFTDSALHNFAKLKPRRALPDSASDSLVVIDSMQPASGYYIARDSAGNVHRVFISYKPKPDTNAPQLPFAPVAAGLVTQNVYEQLPWDRGLQSIVLKPGAKNLVLDSVHYFSTSFARAYLRIPRYADSASGCLIATDSVGNVNTACYQWNGVGGDTLAPVFKQLLLVEPLKSIAGTVTEKRTGDIGLKSVILTPITNAALPAVVFNDKTLAFMTVNISDTMYTSLCKVEASDSAGNFVRDTLRYSPKADILPPQLTLTAPTLATRLVSFTEIQAWDRGIASVAVVGTPTNMTAPAPIFADARHASILLTIADLTKVASAQVVAIDSAGNQSSTLIDYSPTGPSPLRPLVVATPYDFGTIPAGNSATATITLTNPNAVAVTLSKLAIVGDDSVFAIKQSVPISVAAGSSMQLDFSFAPRLIGSWQNTYSFSNDTMLLASIQLLGKSTGRVTLRLDTITLVKAGDQGAMTLRIQAAPQPINLDTIGFTLAWDHDVASLGQLSENCSGLDTGLCNYSITSTVNGSGDVSYLLVRRSRLTSPTLDYSNNAITLPVTTTFVAKATSTSVLFTQVYAGSYSTISGNPGSISVGSVCADSTIRAKLDGTLEVVIRSIQPNPARDQFTVTIHAGRENNVSIDLMDILGHKVFKGSLHLVAGDNNFEIPLKENIHSGSYVLRVRTSDGKAQSCRVVIQR